MRFSVKNNNSGTVIIIGRNLK